MISIVLPISRTTYLKPVFDCLSAVLRPPDTELIIITDGDEELSQAVQKRLDSINYEHIVIQEFGKAPAEHVTHRRQRIADIHNLAKTLVSDKAEWVFCIEDDTTYPAEAIAKMAEVFEFKEGTAFVQGVEVSRHNTPYIGAWRVDDIRDPKKVASLQPSKGLQPIDAGGLYCCLINAKLYRNHEFEVFDKKGRYGLSCDFNLGLSLKRQGYKCFVDWSIQCDHIGDRGSVNLGNTTPVKVIFKKGYNQKWSISKES